MAARKREKNWCFNSQKGLDVHDDVNKKMGANNAWTLCQNMLARDYEEQLCSGGDFCTCFWSVRHHDKPPDREVSTSRTLSLLLLAITVLMAHHRLTSPTPSQRRALFEAVCVGSVQIVACLCQPVGATWANIKPCPRRRQIGADKIQMFYRALDFRSMSLDSPISIASRKMIFFLVKQWHFVRCSEKFQSWSDHIFYWKLSSYDLKLKLP